MELTHPNNTADAAEPSAIVTATPFPKTPIANNDPTRDVSRSQRWMGAVTLVISMVFVLALAVAAVLLLRSL